MDPNAQLARLAREGEIYSNGIYHALPKFPSDIKNLTAIITGANGISGNAMLRVLGQSSRWTKVFCLSRRPPLIEGGLPSNAEHIPCDFLKEPEEIAKVLKEHKVKADHIFFFSYVQPPPKPGMGVWSDAEGLTRLNTALLTNFLTALPLASITPQRIMLQTGAKNYGLHLGAVPVPQQETAARVTNEPNFYYPQEDALWSYCAKNNAGWSVCMPGPILGAVPDAAMNGALGVGIYASVCKKLGEALDFPCDHVAWQMPQTCSSAVMNAYLEEWSVLTPGARNQKFNASDNSAFTWEGCWPRVAGWYGIEYTGPRDGAEYLELEAPYNPRGYGPKGKIRTRFSFTQWAAREDVRKAWKEIVRENGLKVSEEWDEKEAGQTFGFLDFFLAVWGTLLMSTDKAHKLGFHGYVDSSESLLEVLDELAKLKMIPPVPKVKVEFL